MTEVKRQLETERIGRQVEAGVSWKRRWSLSGVAMQHGVITPRLSWEKEGMGKGRPVPAHYASLRNMFHDLLIILENWTGATFASHICFSKSVSSLFSAVGVEGRAWGTRVGSLVSSLA